MLKRLKFAVVLGSMALMSAFAVRAQDPVIFTFGEFGNPVQLDGAVVTDGISFRVLRQGCETLFGFEPGTTNPVPALATSATASEDGLTWVLELNEGITFHDGTPFNAEAVKWNFDRWRDTSNPYHFPEQVFEYYGAQFNGFDDESSIASVEATSEYQVTFNMRQPVGAFLNNLAMPMFSIASPAAIEANGVNYGTPDVGFVCTGPFKFVSWTNDVETVLERNPDYWQEIPSNIDRIVFRQIPDRAASFAALQDGAIDAFESPNVEDIEAIEANEELYIQFRPSFNVFYLAFNYRIQEFRNPLVRQAISLALNRQEIVDAYYAQAIPANTFNPPSIAIGFNDAIETPYNPEDARALLAEAGFPEGIDQVNVLALDAEGNVTETIEATIPFSLFYMPVVRPYNPDGEGIGELMVGYLQEIGINAQLDEAGDWATYLDERRNGNLLGMYQLGWTGDNGDPDNFIGYFFADVATPLAREGYYANPELSSVLLEARTLTDPSAREALYDQAEQIVFDETARIFIAHGQVPMAFSNRVSGYVTSPLGDEAFASVVIGQ
jgi:peptide/nickel transport system substrate-binding protein